LGDPQHLLSEELKYMDFIMGRYLLLTTDLELQHAFANFIAKLMVLLYARLRIKIPNKLQNTLQ